MDSVNLLLPVLGIVGLLIFAGWILSMGSESLSEAYRSLTFGIVACGALLASPVMFYMTWQQFGAKSRLAAEYIPPCNALGHAELAQGGRPPRAIWRFVANDDAARILSYYEVECAKSGWKVERRRNDLLLTRDSGRFAIWSEKSGDQETIVFQKDPPR
jgi:hypothetical protein